MHKILPHFKTAGQVLTLLLLFLASKDFGDFNWQNLASVSVTRKSNIVSRPSAQKPKQPTSLRSSVVFGVCGGIAVRDDDPRGARCLPWCARICILGSREHREVDVASQHSCGEHSVFHHVGHV